MGIGSFDVRQPVAGVTDELTSIGGGILSQFTVTFDQRNNQVFFQRDDPGPLSIPPLRGTGMSFHKTPAYWKVAAVIPGSPAAEDGVAAGDLVSRINGEPVDAWDPARFDKLVSKADHIDFAFIDGTRETAKAVGIADIVP
jgi:C-terminal processing protease CtpA/Prc